MDQWNVKIEIPRKMVLCKLYVDEYCYLECMTICDEILPDYARFMAISKPELKYLDYWKWFWEQGQ